MSKLSKVTYEVVENLKYSQWRVEELFDGEFANDIECKSKISAEKIKGALERRLDSTTGGARMMSESTFTEDLWR